MNPDDATFMGRPVTYDPLRREYTTDDGHVFTEEVLRQLSKGAGIRPPVPANPVNHGIIPTRFLARELFTVTELANIPADQYRALARSRPGYQLRSDPTRPDIYRWMPGAPTQTEENHTMLEQIIRLYTAYMAQDVRSPIPHLAGPPGVGKSSVVQEFADLIGKKLHIVNVARLSPLEIEGVQMPVDDNTRLRMLHSTLWMQLKEGDIVLLDEFMRGYPEVYNALLDIMTSRQVAGYTLPKVFFIAASNSVAAYDKALEDRLLHLYVPDIRNDKRAKTKLKDLFVSELGLNPAVKTFYELDALLDNEVVPMYDVLDQFQQKGSIGTTTIKGQSVRKLIGQALLREVQSNWLRDLIEVNNRRSISDGKYQFVLLLDGRNPDPAYVRGAQQIAGDPKIRAKLTKTQAQNLDLNLQLIEMETAKKEPLNQEGEAA